jgi:hypothetical protein
MKDTLDLILDAFQRRAWSTHGTEIPLEQGAYGAQLQSSASKLGLLDVLRSYFLYEHIICLFFELM